MSGNFLKHLDCDLECPGCIMKQEKVQEVLSEIVHLKKMRYQDSEKVFKRGEPIIGFYIVCCGILREISFSTPDQEITLRVLKEGDILFSDSFFSEKEFYSTTTECITPVEVIFVRRDVLPELMRVAGSSIGERMAKNMVKLRESLEISSYPILVQAAYWLIKLTKDLQCKPSFSDKRLASIIGCSPVTLSNKLCWLEEKGLIVRDGQKIAIPDKNKLLKRLPGPDDPHWLNQFIGE